MFLRYECSIGSDTQIISHANLREICLLVEGADATNCVRELGALPAGCLTSCIANAITLHTDASPPV